MDDAEERRLFFTCLLLSAGLHLALAGLGVMTGWGRTFQPPAVLEVKLVAPPLAPAGEGPGLRGNSSAPPLAGAVPGAAPDKKKPAARTMPPAPRPEPARAEGPATPPPARSLALAVPPRPTSPGPGVGGREQPGGAGPGGSPPSLGTGPGPGGGGQGFGGGPAQGHYLSLIRSRILARRHYPPLARQRQQEGVVRVRFSLSPSGALHQGVEVVRPSGFNLLDEQARQCVLAASPFPPFPRDLNRDHLTIEVPIIYRLTESE